MWDVVFVVIMLAFFAFALGYAQACDAGLGAV